MRPLPLRVMNDGPRQLVAENAAARQKRGCQHDCGHCLFYFMACFGNAQLENFFPIKANKAISAKAWMARFLLTRRACIVKAAGQSAGARRQ